LPKRGSRMSLAADLVCSLFCGLPRLERRMMVFLSASDETSSEGFFHHAGYVASLATWTELVIPAWQEKVLKGPPRLDEFHVTDLRSRAWREEHGFTEESAEARIEAAVDVLSQAEGLLAVRSTIDDTHFKNRSAGLLFKLNDPLRKPTYFQVDYPSFHGYIYIVLMMCAAYPKAEKVDFVIEKKKEVFPAIHDFHEGLAESFKKFGVPRFAELVGELIPGDKKRIPLQAADLLCWHTQRLAASARNPAITFSDVDSQRLSKLARIGMGQTWPREMMEELCDGLFEDWRKLNEVERVPEVRSDDEYDPPSRSKSGESCDGSGDS
jgi:hypothetical protein